MLCLRVIVEDFAFGNPPGYAHANFLEAKITFLTVSMRCARPAVQPTGGLSRLDQDLPTPHRSNRAPLAGVTTL